MFMVHDNDATLLFAAHRDLFFSSTPGVSIFAWGTVWCCLGIGESNHLVCIRIIKSVPVKVQEPIALLIRIQSDRCHCDSLIPLFRTQIEMFDLIFPSNFPRLLHSQLLEPQLH